MDTGIVILIGLAILYLIIRIAFRKPVKRGQKVVFADTSANAQSWPQAPVQPKVQEPEHPKERSIGYHSTTVAVVIPLMMAIVSGTLAALMAVIVMKIWYSWADALITAAVVFLVVTGGVWIWRILDWSKLIHSLETITQVDINGDGRVGELPVPEPVHHITINHYDRNGTYTGSTRAALTISMYDSQALAHAILVEHRPFSETALARGDSKIMSQKRFAHIQDELIQAKLISRKGDGATSGFEFNQDGLDWLGNFLPSPIALDQVPAGTR